METWAWSAPTSIDVIFFYYMTMTSCKTSSSWQFQISLFSSRRMTRLACSCCARACWRCHFSGCWDFRSSGSELWIGKPIPCAVSSCDYMDNARTFRKIWSGICSPKCLYHSMAEFGPLKKQQKLWRLYGEGRAMPVICFERKRSGDPF